MFEDSNVLAELWDMLHIGSATDGEKYEFVYSEQRHMQRYCFKRAHLLF